jgi:hypothetical protein
LSIVGHEKVGCKNSERHSEHVDSTKDSENPKESLAPSGHFVPIPIHAVYIIGEKDELEEYENPTLYACIVVILVVCIKVNIGHGCQH